MAGVAPRGKPKISSYPGRIWSPSLVQTSLHTSTSPTTRGRKRWYPGSKPPRTVGFENKARAPGEERIKPPDEKSLHSLQHRQARDGNGDPPGRNRPARCGNPSSTGRSLIGWGSFIEPAYPGEDRFPSPDCKYFHSFTTPTTWGRKR